MTKKIQKPIAFLTVFAMLLSLLLYFPAGEFVGFDLGLRASAATVTPESPSSGNGTESSPYILTTKEHLYWFANHVNSGNASACAKLGADITVNSNVLDGDGKLNTGDYVSWTEITKEYTGTFDGNNKTIYGLYSTRAMFSENSGTIKNVCLKDSYFYDKGYHLASLCKFNKSGGLITNCSSYATIDRQDGEIRGFVYTGGLCARNEGTLEYCYNAGTIFGAKGIDGEGGAGGLCGRNENLIQYCYNSGTVYVDGTSNTWATDGGGICAEHTGSGLIKNCYNLGDLIGSGATSLGGICSSNHGSIHYCYNNANITGGRYDNDPIYALGGASSDVIRNCYYNIDKNVYQYANFCVKKSTIEFMNGEVAFLLRQATGDNRWKQKIGTHDQPYLGDDDTTDLVFKGGPSGYHNHPDGSMNCGLCSDSDPQPPTLVDGVYQVGTKAELYWIANFSTDAKCVLINDIAFSNSDIWIPIGSSSKNFSGTFDGQGYTISGLNVSGSSDNIGLFGVIGSSGKVMNLGIENCSFAGNNNVGSIAGQNKGTISGCFGYNNTISATNGAGGISATNSGTVDHSFYYGDVDGAADSTLSLTAEQLASGYAAYNLNSDKFVPVWGQTLPGGVKPVRINSTNRVYYGSTYHNHAADLTHCDNCNMDIPEQPPVSDGVYQISLAKHLYWFADYVAKGNTDAKAVLLNDITVNSGVLDSGALNSTAVGTFSRWTPIGTDSNPFKGNFDGNGHYIKGLYLSEPSEMYGGLFGVIGSGGKVSNVGVLDSYINATQAGGIAAKNDGKISGCFSMANVSGTTYGGIAGSGTTGVTYSAFLTDRVSGAPADSTIGKDISAFASGEVTYLLNGNQTTLVWGQKLGVDGDAIPVEKTEENVVYFAQGQYHNHTAEECTICTKKPESIDGVYQISNERELRWFSEYVNNGAVRIKGVLTEDIVIPDGIIFEPIGDLRDPYEGYFDGQGHTVSNLRFTDSGKDYVGLFGIVYSGGDIRNVGIINSTFTGNDYVGSIASYCSGRISGCFSTAAVSGNTNVGGLVGKIVETFGSVTNSYYLGSNVIGASDAGFAAESADFTSGKVAYNLNGNQSTLVWGQKLSGADKDDLPVKKTGSNGVYFAQDIYHNHSGEFCNLCNLVLPSEPPINSEGYYQISNQSHLLWLAECVNSSRLTDVCAILMNDISMENIVMASIGTETNPFCGSFNGDGYTISGLNFTNESADNVGFFGYSSGGKIEKLCIADSTFKGKQYVGAICGYNGGTTISECLVKADVTATKYSGGICGYNGGTIKDCIHVGEVKGERAAGIVGKNESAAKVQDCMNLGNVSGTSCDNIYGDGRMISTNDVENCCFNSDITTCQRGYNGGKKMLEITADTFLPGDPTLWEKQANNYTNYTLYYPTLKNIRANELKVSYTPALIIKNENTLPIKYGDELKFSVDKALKIDGKCYSSGETFDMRDPSLLAGLNLVIKHNGRTLDNNYTFRFDLSPTGSKIWISMLGKDIGYINISGRTPIFVITEKVGAGEITVDVSFTGSIPWIKGAKGSCTTTINKAEAPAVTSPTASDIGYGLPLYYSELSEGWSWVEPFTTPSVSNSGFQAVTNEPVDDANYDYSSVEGYNSATHLITRTIPLTVSEATPTIAVIPSASTATAGSTITVTATVLNPNNNAMTDLPSASLTYKIGNGEPTPVENGTFDIPAETAEGTVITITATTSCTADYFSGTGTAVIVVTECTHEVKTLMNDNGRHWYGCETCGAEIDAEEHSGGTATCITKAVCTVCNQEYGSVNVDNHKNASRSWSCNATGHWHECADCHAPLDLAAHTPSGAASASSASICTVCGYVIESKTGSVATPQIFPRGSTFAETQEVSITCRTSDVEIYYTTNGKAPTISPENKYTGPFTVSATTTVKAIAVKIGMAQSDIASAKFTKKSSGGTAGGGTGGGGGGGYYPSTPSSSEPVINGSAKSWSEIAADLAKLPSGSEVIIELNGITTVPVEVIKVIDERDLKVTFVVDRVKSWKTDGAKIENPVEADLAFNKAVSQSSSGLRGVEGMRFSINDTNIPTDLALAFNAENAGKFANLYKLVDGKPVFVTCAKLDKDGKVVLSGVFEKGEYVVMLCEFSDLPGDMDNDGILNAKDALAVLKDAVGLIKGKNPLAADINGDNVVNAKDALMILKKSVGRF